MGAKAGQTRKSAGRQRLALILFGAVFVLLFVGFAIAQGLTGPSVAAGDVASVSGVPSDIGDVSEADFKRAMVAQIAAGGLKKLPKASSKKYEELKKAALSEELNRIWLIGEAEEFGISVTDKQIAEELANIKKQEFKTKAAYQAFLKKSHFTQADVNERVKLKLITTQIEELLQSSVAPPSNSEIQAYYDAEKATQFTTKASRDVRVIVNEDKKKVEAAKAALEKDNSEKNWKKVAPKYSSDPTTKETGGLQKEITEEFVTGPLKAAIFNSATGELVGPVKFEKNYLLVEPVKLNPQKVKSLGEVRSQISSTLQQEKQQEYFTEFGSKFQAKWVSRTVCASGYVFESCSNYKGSGHPASASPSCYEANPKTPPKECPAVVTPTSPALPGSVTVLKPKGEPFPQRPQPEGSSSGEATGAEGAPTEVTSGG